jgi:hypothetical protein
MTGIAIGFLLLAIVLVWGGLVASIFFLRAHSELTSYPSGGDDDRREEDAPAVRDT